MNHTRNVQVRIYRGLVVLLFGILVANLFQMQIIHHDDYRNQSVSNRQIRVRIRAPRGGILDREGVVLAKNVLQASITMPRSSFADGVLDETTATLVDRFELDAQKTRESFQRQYSSGRSRLTLIPNASMPEVAYVEEWSAHLPDVTVRTEPRREYVYGPLLAHLIGYTGEVRSTELDTVSDFPAYRPGDIIGREGFEAIRETDLRGQNGWYLRGVDARGRMVGTPDVPIVEGRMGQDLQLTVSLALQDSLQSAMAGYTGCAVVLSLPDGDVLASVSLPTYDPNDFSRGISSEDWEGMLNDPDHPFLNRLVQATYPPASPYKVVTSLVALEKSVATPRTRLEPCYGSYHYGDRDFGCWQRYGHGSLDHTGSLIHSCDVFYYQVVQDLSLDQLRSMALRLGLGRSTNSPLRGEQAGIIPDPRWYDEHYGRRRWTNGVLLNNAIGQGEILVTPLQMAVLTGRIATSNGAFMPRFFMDDPVPAARPLNVNEDHVRWVRRTMGQVVDIGTGTRARLQAIEVAGKTGTAENPHGEDHAWFICFAPASHPEVAMAIILEHAGHGGAVAAPVAARWLESYVRWRDRADEGGAS